MRSSFKLLGMFGVGVVAATAVMFAVRARAAGVPEVDALTYTGYLEDAAGAALTGEHSIEVHFWESETATADLCTGKVDATLQSGRFQLPLPIECADAVKATPDIWVDVEVDGGSLGRTKLGAVPFALEAGHATAADSASEAAGALDDRLAALEDGTPGQSMFLATKSVAQSVPADAAFHKLLLDVESFDAASEFDPATSVFTPKSAGVYEIACHIVWHVTAVGTTAGYFETSVWVNGTRRLEDGLQTDGYYTTRVTHGLLKLAAGDQVYCAAYQESGASRDIEFSNARYTTFSAVRLSL